MQGAHDWPVGNPVDPATVDRGLARFDEHHAAAVRSLAETEVPEPPIWLLDIDGVINANKPGWGEAPRRIRCNGFVIRWAPKLIDRIRELHRMGDHEIRWSTTWCGFPDQLDELSRQLGVQFERAFTDRPMSKTWAEMKAEAAVAVLAEGRRLIWTDDDEVPIAPSFYPEIAEAERDGRALLIAPRPNRGLQPEDFDRIAEFR